MCWRNGGAEEAETAKELMLLDCTTHTFVDTCVNLRDVVCLSGDQLADCPAEGNDPTGATAGDVRWATSAAVRILRGGNGAKVSEISCVTEVEGEECATKDADQERYLECEGVIAGPTETSAQQLTMEQSAIDSAAARAIQRVWRDKRRRRLTAWEASIVPSHKFKIKPAPLDGEKCFEPATNPAARDAFGRRQRSRSAGARYGRRADALGLDILGVESQEKDGFSILESLGALDAAERVLSNSQKGSNSNSASNARATSAPATTGSGWSSDDAKGWLNTASRCRLGTSNSEGSGGGGSCGSGAEASTRSLVRATDRLLRETSPVLRRTRSLLVFSPPTGSPVRQRARSITAQGGDDAIPAVLAPSAEDERRDLFAIGSATAAGDGGKGEQHTPQDGSVVVNRAEVG